MGMNAGEAILICFAPLLSRDQLLKEKKMLI